MKMRDLIEKLDTIAELKKRIANQTHFRDQARFHENMSDRVERLTNQINELEGQLQDLMDEDIE
ncbi:hypothetical protein HYP99_gp006 [Sinorhizobium phage ort11]|uniref:Uncharacterized protein n=1 Tax=Sinorhizobium phage ort11 TaxID=2599764 RepID=A0A5C2H1A5_9CAUD|nr:hypothetical protein HYP99_gp006 [Sinorhizobium phage ort11]QEP29804.1 hypothetical protein Smphiort11_006 [Sinorhizobium phage ort11]